MQGLTFGKCDAAIEEEVSQMSRPLTIEISERAYAALESNARAAAQSPAELASKAVEQRFGHENTISDAQKQAARAKFERHFGEVDLPSSSNVHNEAIDADLAREYCDNHDTGR